MTDVIPEENKITWAQAAELLEMPKDWPDGFKWGFGNCANCAMGLIYKSVTRKRLSADIETADMLVRKCISDEADMDQVSFARIFWDTRSEYDRPATRPLGWTMSCVTPDTIAARLDHWLDNERRK